MLSLGKFPKDPLFIGAICLLGLTTLFYIILGWSNPAPPLGSDSIRYILMADHIRAPHSEISATSFFSENLFPPLYPLVLAMAGGGENISALHFVTSMLFGLAVIFSFFWFRREGSGPLAAALLSCCVAFSPAIINQAFEIMSEGLYMALSILSILLFRQKDEPNAENLVLLSVFLCSVAMLARSAGIVLVVAILFHLFYFSYAKRYTCLAIILVPNLTWVVMKSLLFPNIGYTDGLMNIWNRYSLQELMYIPVDNLQSLWWAWLQMFSIYPEPVTMPFLGLILLICVVGFVMRLKALKLDAIYVCLYMGMILLWPFPAESIRFITVIFPFLLFYSLSGTLTIHQWILRGKEFRYYPLLIPVMILLTIGPSFYHIYSRLFIEPMPDKQLANYRKTNIWTLSSDHNSAVKDVELIHRLYLAVKALPNYVDRKQSCVYFVIPPFASYFSGVPTRLMPYYEKDKLSQQDFPDCDYILSSRLIARQAKYKGLYPIPNIDQSHIKPLFVSSLEDDSIAVALVRLRRPVTPPPLGPLNNSLLP